LTYVPAGSEPHKVKKNESWWTLADLPQVRAAQMSANDLCYYNFKTREPREINWYLYYKVGCRTPTRDGKNYMFSGAEKPGIVFLPKVGVKPVVDQGPPTKEEPRLDMWVGLGGKAGTMFVVAGIETMEGLVVSLDEPHQWMVLQASINRLGAGWGVTGGVCLIVVTGVSRPTELNGFQTGGRDFNVAIGENWGKIAKTSNLARKLAPVINAVGKIGARTPRALKAVLKANPDRYVDLTKAAMAFREAMGSEAVLDKNVFMVDVPWLGGGVEVSVFYGVANYTALYDSA
jgi:hypothetical protein